MARRRSWWESCDVNDLSEFDENPFELLLTMLGSNKRQTRMTSWEGPRVVCILWSRGH